MDECEYVIDGRGPVLEKAMSACWILRLQLDGINVSKNRTKELN
jgi:hypothetical protein